MISKFFHDKMKSNKVYKIYPYFFVVTDIVSAGGHKVSNTTLSQSFKPCGCIKGFFNIKKL